MVKSERSGWDTTPLVTQALLPIFELKGSSMRIFEITLKKTGALPALANSGVTEFALTDKDILISTKSLEI